MAMEFSRVISLVADMEIWSGSSNGFSFVISYESRDGPGFHGRTGFVASWRPIHHQKTSAIMIGGSPFKTLAEAALLPRPPVDLGGLGASSPRARG
jgi:hypothetical protein